MRKLTLVKLAVIPLVVFNLACVSLAAMPHWIGDRVVDAIMDWGDEHIGGPFKKGGGDEEATRKVISDIVMPVKAWRAFLDITAGSESHTATAEQDKPGYSQSKGVPMPSGSRTQTPVSQPSNQTPTQQPSLPIIPGGGSREHNAVGPQSHETQAETQSNGTSANPNSETSKSIELKAGGHPVADANQPMHVNLNPEAATGRNATPAPDAAKPQAAPSPAPTPAPQHEGGPSGGGHGPMDGAKQIEHGTTPSEKSVSDAGHIA